MRRPISRKPTPSITGLRAEPDAFRYLETFRLMKAGKTLSRVSVPAGGRKMPEARAFAATNCRRFRVLVAHSEKRVRRRMHRALEFQRDLTIVGEASTTREAVELASQTKPDIFILDLEILRGLRDGAVNSRMPRWGQMDALMVAARESSDAVQAFRLGAHGVVLATAKPTLLRRSLRSIAAGHYWVEEEAVRWLVDAVRCSSDDGRQRAVTGCGLTPRELNIVRRIASGRTNRQVSQEFRISERTVKHHLTNIFTKLGVSNRLQLAIFAIQQRLLVSE